MALVEKKSTILLDKHMFRCTVFSSSLVFSGTEANYVCIVHFHLKGGSGWGKMISE